MIVVGKPELHQQIAPLPAQIAIAMTREPRRASILSIALSTDRSDYIPEELANRRNIRLSDVLVVVWRTFHSAYSSMGYHDRADRRR